jgi:hypothetical protein
MKSNDELSELIQELLILGYTLPELAENWGVHFTTLTNKYKVIKTKKKYINNFEVVSKEEPYYENEWMYGFIPTYTFEELSFREKQFYYNKLKQNN